MPKRTSSKKKRPAEATPEDREFMQMALELAREGAGWVSPNPMVGAVIVRDGEIIATGYHAEHGREHAETVALRNAGAQAEGATLYVNLEPCNGYGLQPPCTETILNSGIRRVVVGARDTHSKGRGGIARLRRAGIEVIEGVLLAESEALNERFFTYTRQGRPFTELKLAATLDGKTATQSGESRWITSKAARRRVHEMRAMADAVAVGIGTVLADDPQLSVRHGRRGGRQPAPVVLDAMLRIPLDAALLRTKTTRKFVVTSKRAPRRHKDALRELGVTLIEVEAKEGRLDLAEAWSALAAERISAIFVEGGSHVAWSVLRAGLVDRLSLFYAPKLLGGERAPGMFSGPGIAALSDAIQVGDLAIERVGEDYLVTGRPMVRAAKLTIRKPKKG